MNQEIAKNYEALRLALSKKESGDIKALKL